MLKLVGDFSKRLLYSAAFAAVDTASRAPNRP